MFAKRFIFAGQLISSSYWMFIIGFYLSSFCFEIIKFIFLGIYFILQYLQKRKKLKVDEFLYFMGNSCVPNTSAGRIKFISFNLSEAIGQSLPGSPFYFQNSRSLFHIWILLKSRCKTMPVSHGCCFAGYWWSRKL